MSEQVPTKDLSIGDRIKSRRIACGWSQATLAANAHVSQQLIAKLEGGEVRETRKLQKISKALGMPVDRLLSDDPWENGDLGSSMDHARLASAELGNLIRDKRKALEMTQLAVAKWIGVTKGAVSHWELGRVDGIDPANFHRLAKLLKFDEADIKRFWQHEVDVTVELPLLPEDEMKVLHLYAALPAGVRAHVRGIIEVLSTSQGEST